MGRIEQRLQALGLILPETPAPIAAYVPALVAGPFVYVSGQLPMAGGLVTCKGKLGDGVTPEAGYEAAKLCALRAISALKSVIGDLDRVLQIVKITGYVNSTPDFTQQPRVVNGASELLEAVFGDRGKHARVAVSVPSLPVDAAVEVELIAFIG